MLRPPYQLTKEQMKKIREILVQFGMEHDIPGWNDPSWLNFEDYDEDEDPEVQKALEEIPELKDPPPEPPKTLTEEQIRRNAERKYRRLEREVELIFRPPGQLLYMTNQAFREAIDKCDQEYQKLAREDGKEPFSIVDVLYPFRNMPEEDINEFKAILKREIEIEARDPEKYRRENPLPPKNEFGQYVIPVPRNE